MNDKEKAPEMGQNPIPADQVPTRKADVPQFPEPENQPVTGEPHDIEVTSEDSDAEVIPIHQSPDLITEVPKSKE